MFEEFKELLSIFNARKVRYLVVGGYAVSLYAQPRSTQDVDILIASDAENARAVYGALQDFGAPFPVAVEIPREKTRLGISVWLYPNAALILATTARVSVS